VDPRAGLDDMEKLKLILPGLELQSLVRPARSQSLYRRRYTGSSVPHYYYYCYYIITVIIITGARGTALA
jgi:hypothetical protein